MKETFLPNDTLNRHSASIEAPASRPHCFVVTPCHAYAAGKIMLRSWGVSYRAAVDAAVVIQFTKETGIQVTVIDTPDLAKVKAHQMTGKIECGVFDALGAMAANGSKAGFWEPLDPSIVDPKDWHRRQQ